MRTLIKNYCTVHSDYKTVQTQTNIYVLRKHLVQNMSIVLLPQRSSARAFTNQRNCLEMLCENKTNMNLRRIIMHALLKQTMLFSFANKIKPWPDIPNAPRFANLHTKRSTALRIYAELNTILTNVALKISNALHDNATQILHLRKPKITKTEPIS